MNPHEVGERPQRSAEYACLCATLLFPEYRLYLGTTAEETPHPHHKQNVGPPARDGW